MRTMHVVSLLVIAAAFCSCETMKGAAKGTATGFKQDVNNVGQIANEVHPIIGAKKLDNWMQNHMW